ncbi:transmembrane protease serine 9-like [Musca autumnalis]|uniref:transmembrane protease serine 9-like n=1 Tax=Musca autumnalis TaxID=221902 RepID=UPI003CEDEEDB
MLSIRNYLLIVCAGFFAYLAKGQEYASECSLPNNKTGLCMPVKSCRPIYETLRKAQAENRQLTTDESANLQKFFCGTISNTVHVCCAESDIQLNADGLEILEKQDQCGVFTTNKISNGVEAALFSFPWMALLIYNDTRDPYKCGGALISERYVLTAAHCLKPDLYLVRLGEHRISTEKDCLPNGLVCAPPVENVEIEAAIKHYLYRRFSHDIALLRLKRSIGVQKHIRPICLPIYDDLRRKSHEQYVISGWGRKESAPLSDVLMAAVIPFVEIPECQTVLQRYRLRSKLNESHICAGNRNLIDSCDGDSGGPLGFKDTYNGRPRFIQFGVVAFGVNLCGEGNTPNVYTNVSHYMQWITDTIRKYGSPCTTSDNVAGICVPVKSCKPAYDFFNQLKENHREITSSEREEIQSLHCGTFWNGPHICCETSKVQLNPDGLSVLQNQTCGVYFRDKVTYGYEARLMGYPWMALLVYDDEKDPYKCAGSLISEQYVLTAAHCIRGREMSIMYVRLGEHNKTSAVDCLKLGPKTICAPPPVEVGIEEFILHPNYRSVYNDIALLRLERKVAPDLHIRPTCLPIFDDLRQKEHEQYVLSGWGRTETGNSSDVLKVALVPRVDIATCENQLQPYRFRHHLNTSHICAGSKDLVDACKGDSGGPLGFLDIYNGQSRFVQYGIVTVGVDKCGEKNVPGIYANVSHYMQWITDHIKLE